MNSFVVVDILFQILNSLCASGTRLAQAIATLEQWGKTFYQCKSIFFAIVYCAYLLALI